MGALRVAIDGSELTVVADVAASWGHQENCYGFCGRRSVPYGAGQIGVKVEVVTSPKIGAASVKSFAKTHVGAGNGKHSRYALADGTLTIQASMDAVTLKVLPKSGKHGYWETFNIASEGRVKYWLKFYIRFNESGPRQPGDTKEWDTQFWSGGLPELGKRR